MEGIKNIAIIYGGSSAEREVSIESGEGIFNGLSKIGIKSTLIEYADFEQISLDNFDLVFIALHGHEACPFCKSNIAECFSGDNCEIDRN